jgi:hypothetical protein
MEKKCEIIAAQDQALLTTYTATKLTNRNR